MYLPYQAVHPTKVFNLGEILRMKSSSREIQKLFNLSCWFFSVQILLQENKI